MRALVFGAAAAAVLLAGCTSSPTPSGPPTAISPAPTEATRLAGRSTGRWRNACTDHGVTDSGGSAVLGPPAGVDQATWDQAMKACATLAPGPAS